MSTTHSVLLRKKTAEKSLAGRQCSVLVADSNREFREGLRSLLSFYNHHSPEKCVVVGEVISGAQALQLSLSQHPSLVILDVQLESSWAKTIETIAALQQLEKPPLILLMAESTEPKYLFEGMQAGAAGYITKDYIATELLTAIHTIRTGKIYLNQEMVSHFFYLFQSHAKQSVEKCQQLRLSKREQEVLQLLSRGESNDDIASELYISVATVKSHFTSIFEKLGVKSRTQAIIQALRLGLVS